MLVVVTQQVADVVVDYRPNGCHVRCHVAGRIPVATPLHNAEHVTSPEDGSGSLLAVRRRTGSDVQMVNPSPRKAVQNVSCGAQCTHGILAVTMVE